MTPAKARKMFRSGASARAVMRDAGIKPVDLARTLGLPQSRVGEVLAGQQSRTNGPRGREMARLIYGAIADQLKIDVKDIPEGKQYVDWVVDGRRESLEDEDAEQPY